MKPEHFPETDSSCSRPVFSYPVTENQAGTTVEELLLSQGYSRRLVTALKKAPDRLTIGRESVYVTRRLLPGEILTVRLPPEPASCHIVPSKLPFPVVYEDRHILVVNKPADMPIHPSQGNHCNSLANAAAWYYAQKKEPFTCRIINRLDRDTTGLLILAKHALSACILSDMVNTHEIRRTYLAAVEGNMAGLCGSIQAPIARVEGSVLKRQVDFAGGEHAVTHYQTLQWIPELNASLVQLQLETGRTHQIRVHMKYLGHPLFGDFLYHPDYRYIRRQSLHSWKLAFHHPITKEPLAFTAAVPDDMQIFCHALDL